MRPDMKYREIKRLVPLVIYFYSKFQQLPIDEHELIKVSNITKKEFFNFKLQIVSFMSKEALYSESSVNKNEINLEKVINH